MLQSARGNTKRSWGVLNSLLGERGNGSAPGPEFSAKDYHSYIEAKLEKIRGTTSNAGPASYTEYHGSRLDTLSPPTLDEVRAVVRDSPNKQCASDPMPTWLLKECIEELAPYLVTLITVSLESGEFPSSWKHAIVTPLLKKPGLDQSEVSSYRPVANLPFLSKVLERIVNKRLINFLSANSLLPKEQSAYRRGFSTETAILKIFSDLVDATASGRVALLCLLDLSAAFETVDHQILIRRLETSFGITGKALQLITDYLVDRTQSVWCNGETSSTGNVYHGVPQGSVLGPLLFILYVADMGKMVKAFGLSFHAYADDGQIYSSCNPSELDQLRKSIDDCLSAVSAWTRENRLALNLDKTEFLWMSTPGRRRLLNQDPFVMGDVSIAPSTSVRLLGVILDETLTLEAHVNSVIRGCHNQIRRVKQVRRYLTVGAAIQLIQAVVLSKLDYCNSVLHGLSDSKLCRLQSVMNLAVRVIFGCRWNDHISPLLRDRLHWLRVQQRIVFKRCWFTFRVLYDPFCPEYLTAQIQRTTANERRSRLRSGKRTKLIVPPPSATPVFGERSFSKANPLLWNELPDDVTDAASAESFRKNLKTHLFKIGFDFTC